MKNPYFIPLISSAIMILGILLVVGFLPPEVPLLYGNIQGQGQLVPTLILITAPLGSIVITLVNYYLSTKITDKLFNKALFLVTILVNLMVFITLVKIILLVGFF